MTQQENALTGQSKCSPLWYGVGAFFATPIAVIFCVLMGVMLALAWPFIPFLCYMQRRDGIRKGGLNR
jgi:hypothetical protein